MAKGNGFAFLLQKKYSWKKKIIRDKTPLIVQDWAQISQKWVKKFLALLIVPMNNK